MNKQGIFVISKSDIFKSNCQCFVNPVNCIGIMGKGLALKFKRNFPEMYQDYKQYCKKYQLLIGQLHIWENPKKTAPEYIINFPTKRHYNKPSNIKFIQIGLKSLKIAILRYNIYSIAIPALGCGLGGLNFIDVVTSIKSELSDLRNIQINIFQPKEIKRFLEIL